MTAQRCDGTPYVTGVIPDGMTVRRHAVSVRDSGADETALIAVGGGGAIVALAVAPYRRQKDIEDEPNRRSGRGSSLL
jgi:hypothetical protein